MDHLKLILAMLATCIASAAANTVIARYTGWNVLTFCLWFVVPVGALFVGFAGASGAVLAARYLFIKPKPVDAVPMLAMAAGTMVLAYYLDFVTMQLPDGRRVADLVPFVRYVDFTLTTAHWRVGRMMQDVGEVGNFGYVQAGLEFVGVLVGGLCALGTIKGMPQCQECTAYLRRFKTKRIDKLTFDQAAGARQIFSTGDLNLFLQLIGWKRPTDQVNPEGQQVRVSYKLYVCPKCQAEAAFMSCEALRGKEWKAVPDLSVRRNLDRGLSLRGPFD